MNFPYISDHVQRHEDRHPLNAKTTFGTQTQLFDEMSKYSAWLRFLPPFGHCSAFSNMCAEARMRGEELPAFLKESTYNRIYQSARSVDKVQRKLFNQEIDGEHLAFLDKKHEITFYKTTPDKGAVFSKMGKFNLVGYPTRGGLEHQVYFEKGGDGQCKLFDADEPGGLRSGPCAQLLDSIWKSIYFYPADKQAKVTIASSNGESK